jgi:hypothetical protein
MSLWTVRQDLELRAQANRSLLALPDMDNKFRRLLELGTDGIVADFTQEEECVIERWKLILEPRRKSCFKNCQTAVLVPNCPFRYVEGFVVNHWEMPLAVEHAWLTLHGKLIEFTLPKIASSYFGIEIPAEIVEEFVFDGEEHGPLLDDIHTGWKYTAKVLQMEPPRVRFVN